MSQDRIPRDVAHPAPRLGAFLRRFPRRFWFSAGAAVLACAAMYGVESVVESWLESGPRGHSPLTRSVFELSRLYQAAVTVGWRKPQPPFTVIVELSVDRDAQLKSVSVNMVCAQREFLARLVKKITTVGPAVIVLDKYFSRGTCDEDRIDRPAPTS